MTYSITMTDTPRYTVFPAVIKRWRRFKHSFEVLQWRAARVPYVPRAGDPPDLKIYPGGMARGWNPLYSPNLIQIGLPDVVTLSGDFQPFTKAWQEYHYNLLKLSAPSLTETQLKAAFAKIFDSGRFLNNGYGVDVYHDYINGRNTTKADPKFEALGMGGNIVKELDRYSYGGEWWVEVECLSSVPGSAVTWRTHPHLIYHAVNERMTNGLPEVTEFPQLGGAPVYYALAHKTGKQSVRESWLIEA